MHVNVLTAVAMLYYFGSDCPVEIEIIAESLNLQSTQLFNDLEISYYFTTLLVKLL